jgi:hypothetical protein
MSADPPPGSSSKRRRVALVAVLGLVLLAALAGVTRGPELVERYRAARVERWLEQVSAKDVHVSENGCGASGPAFELYQQGPKALPRLLPRAREEATLDAETTWRTLAIYTGRYVLRRSPTPSKETLTDVPVELLDLMASSLESKHAPLRSWVLNFLAADADARTVLAQIRHLDRLAHKPGDPGELERTVVALRCFATRTTRSCVRPRTRSRTTGALTRRRAPSARTTGSASP